MRYFLLDTSEMFSRGRFPRIRRLVIRLVNVALVGLLAFSLVSGVLLALRTF